MIKYSDIYLYYGIEMLKNAYLFDSFFVKNCSTHFIVINMIIMTKKSFQKCLRRVFIVSAMHTRDKQSDARNRHAIACQFPSTIRRNFEVYIGDIACRYKSAISFPVYKSQYTS